ncbi:MAG: Uma2 family endonuclease [Planctomycetales bacterium]
MSHPLLEQVVRGEAPPLVPLTVDQYEGFTASGLIPEGSPIELIDGFLVYKDRADSRSDNPMNQGPDHSLVVEDLAELIRDQVKPAGLLARCQLPIRIAPRHAPEPDVSIVAGPARQRGGRLPEPADVLAVFEVAHSSRNFDRSTKQRVYADAGIPVFVIVDLIAEAIEVYTEPLPGTGTYDKCLPHPRGTVAAVDLRGGVRIELEVDAILP